jgi:hypothetical protein
MISYILRFHQAFATAKPPRFARAEQLQAAFGARVSTPAAGLWKRPPGVAVEEMEIDVLV